jgi:GT2 family glycosyltransferase
VDLYQQNNRVTLIQHSQNLGFAKANNYFIKQVKADYILLLNPDCFIKPNTIEQVLSVLKQNPQAGMVGCRILNPDGSEQRGCRRTLPSLKTATNQTGLGRVLAGKTTDLSQQEIPLEPLQVEAISGAFMLLRKQAIEQVGLMDEGYFLHCEDLDWCRRFYNQNWLILFVGQTEIIHYQGTCSQSNPIKVNWHKHQGMRRYYKKFIAQDHRYFVNQLVYFGIYMRFLSSSIMSKFNVK